mgnify:FL=1
MNENKNKTQIIFIIFGAIVIIGILAVAIYFSSTSNKTSNAEVESQIQEKTQNIAEKFGTISAEILESDGKTVKSEYSQTVKDEYAVFQSKVAEMGEIIESKDKDQSLTADAYYEKLSKVVDEAEKLITALDGELHLNKADFQTTFTELKNLFDTITKKMVSGDGVHLVDQYKDYQAEFDSIRESVISLTDDLNGDDTKQEYYDNLTKKGKDIIEKVRELAQKANVEI